MATHAKLADNGSVASDGGAVLPLLYLVRHSGEFEEGPGGPAALVAVVRVMKGDTSAVQRYIRGAGRTRPHRLRDDV